MQYTCRAPIPSQSGNKFIFPRSAKNTSCNQGFKNQFQFSVIRVFFFFVLKQDHSETDFNSDNKSKYYQHHLLTFSPSVANSWAFMKHTQCCDKTRTSTFHFVPFWEVNCSNSRFHLSHLISLYSLIWIRNLQLAVDPFQLKLKSTYPL